MVARQHQDQISYIDSFNGALVFANADGTGLQPSYSGRGTSVQWSPDSARVTFQRSGAYWVMNADGTNRRQLSDQEISRAFWSPDGTRIAYVADGLWVVNADGTNRIQLAEEGGFPIWAPLVV